MSFKALPLTQKKLRSKLGRAVTKDEKTLLRLLRREERAEKRWEKLLRREDERLKRKAIEDFDDAYDEWQCQTRQQVYPLEIEANLLEREIVEETKRIEDEERIFQSKWHTLVQIRLYQFQVIPIKKILQSKKYRLGVTLKHKRLDVQASIPRPIHFRALAWYNAPFVEIVQWIKHTFHTMPSEILFDIFGQLTTRMARRMILVSKFFTAFIFCHPQLCQLQFHYVDSSRVDW